MQIITDSNVKIFRKETPIDVGEGISFLIDYLETNQGMFLSSGTEYPGRYSRWETGFFAPPVEIIAYFERVIFKAHNQKGAVLLDIFENILQENQKQYSLSKVGNELLAYIKPAEEIFKEEDRSKQPSVLTPIRTILNALKHNEHDASGFYGAFGFDLLFQFEKINLINTRDENQPVIRLFFPDRIYTFDRKKEEGFLYEYDFSYKNLSTEGILFDEIPTAIKPNDTHSLNIDSAVKSNLSDKEYAALVEKAKEKMLVGEIFELVLRRKYFAPYTGSCAQLFRKMIEINPSPYQFFCQFKDEQLIGTSPEMFVRVTQDRVESCPISGTIKRGKNPIEDAEQIKALLNSEKDEVELTMCTDVDRNDKSRVCKPGSIRLLGRRQIEKYRGLFHTVDHVEGILREDCDGIDAFLSHMWAVTLMGSPKSTAASLIEEYEDEPREYYGGAIGALFSNGNINTGITIRTIHLKDGIANYSVGASLVYDSDGDDEAIETQIKATSFFNIFKPKTDIKEEKNAPVGKDLKIVVIDNQDSFVNTLSDYFRQTGAEVVTYRSGVALDVLLAENPDLIMHSPGPKLPKDFGMPELIKKITELGIPQFGVCLGLQGMIEAFGGSLKRLDIPHQGKKWTITHTNKNIFENLPTPCKVGAYHSWVADEKALPDCLEIIAKTNEGLVMGISHKDKPLWAVQFHPESIMSMDSDLGYHLIENVIKCVKNERNS